MLVGIILLLPSLTGVTVMYLYPLAKTIFQSFFSSIHNGTFVGFENFADLFFNNAFILAIKNTFVFYIVAFPLIIILPLVIALIFPGKRKIDKAVKNSIFFTLLLPTASLMTVISLMFSTGGLFSEFIAELLQLDPDKLYDSKFAFILLVTLFIYKYGGYNFLIYTAALYKIPKEYYEEAMIAGAGRFKCIFYITLPSLRPIFAAITMLSILNSYKIYREAYLIGGSYPNDSIYLIQHFISNNFINMNYNRLCSVTVTIMLVAILAIFIAWACFMYIRRTENAKK